MQERTANESKEGLTIPQSRTDLRYFFEGEAAEKQNPVFLDGAEELFDFSNVDKSADVWMEKQRGMQKENGDRISDICLRTFAFKEK